MNGKLKRFLIGSRFGGRAVETRDRLLILHAAICRLPELPMLTNDYLARRLVTRLCKPGCTFVDIGAHIGSVVAEVRNCVPTANVIAFEAIPEKATDIQQRYPETKVYQCALGSEDTEVQFVVDHSNSGYSSVSTQNRSNPADTTTILVKMHRLDSIIREAAIDVIKIDVEGSELDVLEGASENIDRNRPIIMYESGPVEPHGNHDRVHMEWDFFSDNRYAIVAPNRLSHDAPGQARDTYVDCHYYPRCTSNYFAIPRERLQEIRTRAAGITGTNR